MTSSRTAVFRRVVSERMAPPPVLVSPETDTAEVLRRMAEAAASAALVVDATHRIVGIVTEQDAVRRFPNRAGPVSGVMSAPVLTVRPDEHLYRAIGFMRRRRLRHQPVVDGDGAVVGMLELHEALAIAAGPLVDDIDQLTHEDSLAGLARVKAAQVRLAERLLADGVPAPEIQALLADINNDLHRRVLRLLVAELGPPPIAFACIVMGSGGRGESLLFPDQDNGFVLADYPEERQEEIDAWFVGLARRMTAALDGLGIPLCRGGVMATSPIWRKTLAQWRQQVALWMRGRDPEMLLACDILFDFRCVYGECPLAEELRAHVTRAAAGDHGFLMLMFGLQAEHRASIGLFGRLRPEIDLKLNGTLPLAEGVRLLALGRGIAATGTLDRIDGLVALEALAADDADRLRGAFGLLTGLQLRQQIADYRAGRPVGNLVAPGRLTGREREELRRSLRAVNEFRARIRADLTGCLL